jgi:NADH-ubiquinone oxidoreductase chain 4
MVWWKKIKMIDLNYLTTVSLISLWFSLFLGRYILIDERVYETNILDIVSTIEENKHEIPLLLQNYWNKTIYPNSLFISILGTSFWFNNTEKKEEKEIKINKQKGYLRQKYMGLCYSFVVLTIILIIWHFFSRIELGFQFKPEIIRWLGKNINSFLWIWLGIDALSLPFLLLIAFIFPIVYLSNWTTVDKDDGYYVPLVSSLQWLLLTVFIVIDLILFYIFFESILPPLFLMIGLYGAAQKFRAGYYIFLYTLLGSLFMLLVFVKMGGDTATTYFEGFNVLNLYSLLQEFIWVVLFVSFSVKTPLVPVHIWLPLAHSDANVSGSIILASIVLKLALYGFIRILIGIFSFATSRLIPFFFGLCSLSVIYSSVTTVRQFDLKVLVAYSSIAHMASSLLGTFSDTLVGIVGSILFGLAHGFVSPGLFILVGAILYDRCGSRIINYYRGLSNLLPFFALLFLLFVFGNMGVPLTGNFIGEFLSLLGAFQQNIFIASIGATSVVLSAVYSIFMYNRVTGGSISPFVHTIPDIFRKEFYIILPLLILTLILGIYPSFISYDVEYGLSNYLLFTFFPAVLSDNGNNEPGNNNNGSNGDSDSDSHKRGYNSGNDGDDELSDGESDSGESSSSNDSTKAVYGDDEDPVVESDDENPDNPNNPDDHHDHHNRDNPDDSDDSDSSDNTGQINSDNDNEGNSTNATIDDSDIPNITDNEGNNCNSQNEGNNSNPHNGRNNGNVNDNSTSSSDVSDDLSDDQSSGSDTQPSDTEGGNRPVHPNHNDGEPGQNFPPNIVPPNTPETGIVAPPILNIPTHIELRTIDSESESSNSDSGINPNNNRNTNECQKAKPISNSDIDKDLNIVKGNDEWGDIGFTYSDDDWFTIWVKVMSELSGWSIEIGFNNIISSLFILFFIFRLFLGYYNSFIICLHYFRINFIFFKENLYSFLSKFMNNK